MYTHTRRGEREIKRKKGREEEEKGGIWACVMAKLAFLIVAVHFRPFPKSSGFRGHIHQQRTCVPERGPHTHTHTSESILMRTTS